MSPGLDALRRSGLAFGLVFAFSSATALAAPPEAPRAPGPEVSPSPEEDRPTNDAREAFLLGSQLAHSNQWRDALVAFERSAELRPHVVTTYNIGYIERALGHLTRARKYLKSSLAPGQGAGVLPEDLAILGRSYLVEIEQKLARVPVTVSRDGIQLLVDNRPLEITEGEHRTTLVAGTLPLGGAPTPVPAREFDLLVDPGSHVIVISAQGAEDNVLTPTFEEGSVLPLRLEVAAQPPLSPTQPIAQPALTKPDSAPDRSGSRIPPATWAAFGVGAAGLVGASVFGLLALGESSKLSDACKPSSNCPDTAQGDLDRLHRYGTMADVSFGVAVVGAVTGTVLWLTTGRVERPTPRGSPRVEAAATGSSFGLGVRGEL